MATDAYPALITEGAAAHAHRAERENGRSGTAPSPNAETLPTHSFV